MTKPVMWHTWPAPTGVELLSDMEDHAGIEPFVREGYEITSL